ncbi:hypothetical protein PA27867_0432 [Cryobacterium arcticum]|uniref:Uncharacterized protein n=1 Tax=Cryobacterium arcticum TaxID=670052 RepID=A0A1B1BFQ7_9MICO|nr:hypothetical protein PA27867_0432 [Cryobacterium arcticum]
MGARHTLTSPGLDKLDHREGTTHTHPPEPDSATQPNRRSSLSRPRKPNRVSTSSTTVRARHTLTSPGLDKLDHRGGTTHTQPPEPDSATQPNRRSSLSRPRKPNRVSTSSTTVGARHTLTSPGLDKLDHREGTTHTHPPEPDSATQPNRRSSLSRPRKPNRVSTSSTTVRARHTLTSPGLDKLDHRGGTTHTHVTWSRQARPPRGHDTHATTRTRQCDSTQPPVEPVETPQSEPGLDKLDHRGGTTHTHPPEPDSATQPNRRSSLSRPRGTIRGRRSRPRSRPAWGCDTHGGRGTEMRTSRLR